MEAPVTLETDTRYLPIEFKLSQQSGDEVEYAQRIVRKSKNPSIQELFATNPEQAVTQATQELAERFAYNLYDTEEPLAMVTIRFLRWTSYEMNDKRGDIADTAWSNNLGFKKIIMDSLLRAAEIRARKGLDQKAIDTITEARELLHLPETEYAAGFYIGTSSAILPGVEQAQGRLLSIGKLKELGIIRKTGEGARGGASAEGIKDRGISVTNSFEVADTYANLNSTLYFKTPEKAQAEIARLDEQMVYWQQVLEKPPSHLFGHEDARERLEDLQDRRVLAEEQLKELSGAPQQVDKQEVFPIIFGLGNINIVRQEVNENSFRTEPEIDLRSQLKRVYCPAERIDQVRGWFKKLGMKEVIVDPLESMRIIRRMDPRHEKDRVEMEGFVRVQQARNS